MIDIKEAFTDDNYNNLSEEITTINYTIRRKIQQDEENFIFETIEPFCTDVLQKKISKRELINRLTRPEAMRQAAVNDLGMRICKAYLEEPDFCASRIMELTREVAEDRDPYIYTSDEEDDGK